ncbi:MAG: PP2C family protein-serine/threonine phosphatase, partial [Anaerolineales bacterium]|nr:PP2C family protein-serine/threonine phosphatase [Anaerolineales bacterium]
VRQALALRGGESRTHIRRAIPLVVPGTLPVGVVTVVDRLPGVQDGNTRERDLQMMGFLNQAARALQIVSTRRHELSMAGRIQSSLLPESPPEPAGWRMAATWLPARETSGDFYDFIEFPNGRVGIVLGDVTDKGMGAALYMALCRTLIRTYASVYPESPTRVLQAANRQLCADTHGGLFIPLIYGVLDPGSARLAYCNAGHHPPYHFPARDLQTQYPLKNTGLPLGVMPEATWEQVDLDLDPGDLLLLYTDGAVEAHNHKREVFGDQRMLDIVSPLRRRSPRHIQEALVSGVRAYSAGNQLSDDLTLVLIQREAV